MKKVMAIPLFLLLTVQLVLSVQESEACVGKTLNIGVLDTPAEHILSDILFVLVNERTGTTVAVKRYKNAEELYGAAKRNEIGIIIDNTDRSLATLGRQRETDIKKAYDISREEFRKKYNLVWLNPFGALTGERGMAALFVPVLTAEALANFPALPRVINKLAGVMNDDSYAKLVKAESAPEKAHKAARDFLKQKKLI